MRTILLLLEKEFRQIFRNKGLVASIVVAPIIQLLILPLAADFEVKNILIAVVDHDHSSYSQQMVSKITSSGYFTLVDYNGSFKDAVTLVDEEKADLVLEIPAGFERGIIRENEQKLFLAINAINGVKAGLGGAYLSNIIKDFNNIIRLEWIEPTRYSPMPVIEMTSLYWYNPLMKYKLFIVPGLLVLLITGGATFLTTINIVREKEIGTIEQINVSPIKKHHFILGKLIPFWIIEMGVFTVGLFLAWLIYGIVPVGSIGLLYAFLAIYLWGILGFGLLVSSVSHTQQEGMFVAFFFMMIFNLMSGLFTPINSMPDWAKLITQLNPVTHFVEVMRMVVLKGSGFYDIRNHFFIITVVAIVINIWAVLNYRKTT